MEEKKGKENKYIFKTCNKTVVGLLLHMRYEGFRHLKEKKKKKKSGLRASSSRGSKSHTGHLVSRRSNNHSITPSHCGGTRNL